jgi:AAA+ superfamily predicted ATPase
MGVAIEAIQDVDRDGNRSAAFVDLIVALNCLDELLKQAVESAERLYGYPASDPYRGLYIDQDEVARLFSESPGSARLSCDEHGPRKLLERLRERLSANTSMKLLMETFGLQTLDLEIILLALAPEVDLRYQRLFAYLQDDVTRRRPSVDLALNLFCVSPAEKVLRRAQFAPDAPLIGQRVLRLISDQSQSAPPLLANYLKLDEQITEFLLGQNTLDPRLAPFCEFIKPQLPLDGLALSPEIKRGLASLISRAKNDCRPLRLYFSGACKWDKRPAAEALSLEAGVSLLVVDLNHMLATESDFASTIHYLFRQAWILGSLIYIDGCDPLHSDNYIHQLRFFQTALQKFRGIAVLAGEQDRAPVQTTDCVKPLGLIDVTFTIPRFAERRECWRSGLEAAGVVIDASELDVIAGRFRLSPTQVSEAVALASNKSLWRAGSDPAVKGSVPQPTFSDFCAAARVQTQHQLGSLARKIEPLYTWDDIVLGKDSLDQLRDLCSRVAERRRVLGEWGFGRKLSLGKGVTALFAGPSGTGKTMAAEIVANELELELYKIDLSGVVSKYIGETEKNLDRVFTTAENANAILFFDEADALFGKRSEVRDSHDRYANIEISYLLQKMEQYEGVAILATNLRQNLDDAFLRRLQFIVEFPFPDETHRRRIWEQLFSDESPRESVIDFDFLARRFRLAGGNIRNIVLGSAYLAAADGGLINMKHVLQSAQREYRKLGKVLTDSASEN